MLGKELGKMARNINRLNARKVATVTKHGRYADGGNLYLRVSSTGAKSWGFMFRWQGGTKEIGFGSARDVPLADARELAAAARSQLAKGALPIGPRRPAEGHTFGDVADRVVEAMRPQWRSAKHAKQWAGTLTDYAASLRKMPVEEVDTEAVLSVLRPLWNSRHVTATRVRSRIERVLDAAKARGLRSGENPARWRGHLDQLLPRRQKIERAHHPAMPYADVPAFMARLREIEGTTARALEFAILTGARTGEVLGARQSELDLDAALWTVPAPRTKGGREHAVPLSPRAVEIVRQMPEGEFVFPGRAPGTRLSVNMLYHLLNRRMKVVGATVHGFRSSFRDWAGDLTSHPRDVVEAALAHVISNQTEAAYRRSTALEKRRKLMEDWAMYCGAPNIAILRRELI
jgi:integrase